MTPRWINADKPHLWKADIAASVDQFNEWFMEFAPRTFRATRLKTTEHVQAALIAVHDLRNLDAETLRSNPGALLTLRMCMAPPLAVDRLIGLAHVGSSLVKRLETGALPPRMKPEALAESLQSISDVLIRLLDRDIFPWLDTGEKPTDHERERAATIIADRLCSAVAKDIVRRAQRSHQHSAIAEYLDSLGYREAALGNYSNCVGTEFQTYKFDVAIPVALGRDAILYFDVLIESVRSDGSRTHSLLDFPAWQSFRDAAEGSKRCIKKLRALQMTYGESVKFILMLSGPLDGRVLGRLAGDLLDWIWESRIEDLGAAADPDRPVVRI